ncbi:hypothetical protein BYT27DRAFT_7341548 [Phlegmacium glaucopus]|nr:hypothetical protein BYT27DRAFT_7341548 [Phlegmacium glaucopus]
MSEDSTSQDAIVAVPLDVGNNSHVTVSTVLDCATSLPASIDDELPTEPAPIDEALPSETVPTIVTELYYYQKLRESADRFAHQLSTSTYVDDVETTWRAFDDKKRELVITSAMRYITFDPEADFNRFDDMAMSAMTSVMLTIVRNSKKTTKKYVGNTLLRRAVLQAAEKANKFEFE